MAIGFNKYEKKHAKKVDPAFESYLLGEDSPFAMQEAYKALRTNIIFSIPDDDCKVVLFTSSVQGEAKSTTAINVAIAFAQNNSKVLLIDADLRLPTCAARLNVADKPGLSNFLVGMNDYNACIRQLPNGLDFVPAGDIPPNPTELLGSAAMERLLSVLKQRYEYIIIDTPPVCTVADAAILAKQASGVALVVRQHVASRESVTEALSRLKFAEAKILGLVFTGVENEKQKSYKKGYGKGGYGYGYASAHGAATEAVSKNTMQIKAEEVKAAAEAAGAEKQ